MLCKTRNYAISFDNFLRKIPKEFSYKPSYNLIEVWGFFSFVVSEGPH